jgi:uncharacterized protein YdaU (DUF1376 family)
MSEFPSMPLFVGDMLADTEHLTNEEFGVYHRLLYAMWRHNGWVPDDDKDLARVCHVWRRRWPYVKKRLLPFLIRQDGKLSQKNLLRIQERVALLRTKNAQNGAKASHARVNKNKDITSAMGGATRARGSKTKSKEESSEMVAPSFRARSGNGSAASAGSPGCEGRSPAPLSEAKPPGRPSEVLSDEEIAAIKKRLSFTY